MSRIHLTVMLAGAALFAGCPGTIDDPSAFEEVGQGAGSVTADAGAAAGRGDAGSPASSGIDAGAAKDAGTTASCDFKALMQSKCGSSGCHGAPALSTGLDLTSDGLAARLQGKQATGGCSDYLLIDPDNPERSALYLSTTKDPCGIRMPLGGNLSDAEQTCILQWIENL